MATAGIALGQSILSSITSQLAQHSARIKAAKDENSALPQAVQAFDADVTEIVDAYNSGNATPDEVIQACVNVDKNIYTYLRSHVGPAGTAWDDSTGMSGKCNRQCTAGCCVYFGDLGPVLSLIQICVGGAGGAWGKRDPRLSLTANGGTIQVPTVYGSKYGGINRPGYSISIAKPSAPASALSNIKHSLENLTGQPGALSDLGAATGSLPGIQNSNNLLLIVGVFFLLLFSLVIIRK